MEKFFEQVLHVYERLGFSGTFAFLILFLFVALIYDFGKKINEKIVSTRLSFFKGDEKLSKSLIFKKLEILENHKLKRVNISCPLRKKIFMDIVKSRIKCLRHNLLKIREKDISGLNRDSFSLFWEDFFYEATKSSNAELISDGIPEIAIDKYQSFDFDGTIVLKQFINTVCYSEHVYDSNIEKTHVIFDFIGVAADMLLTNIEGSISRINGQLNRTSYKGISCDNCTGVCDKKLGEHKSV